MFNYLYEINRLKKVMERKKKTMKEQSFNLQ